MNHNQGKTNQTSTISNDLINYKKEKIFKKVQDYQKRETVFETQLESDKIEEELLKEKSKIF